MSRGHGHQPKHAGAERPAPPTSGSGAQPPAPLPAVFRWDGGAGHFIACSGQHRIGYVTRRKTVERWMWSLSAVMLDGECSSEEDAKRALRRAWLRWLAERGLQEIRP